MKKIAFSILIISLINIVSVFAQSRELIVGESIEGTLTDDQLVIEYAFSANKGDRLTISASSNQFDTLLTVSNADGKVVAINDDANGSLNSLIDDFVVTADDEYILSITSSDGSEVGDYTLIFNPAYLQSLSYGETVTGTLDETTQEVIYQFEGTEGDVVTILMSSDTINSFVSLANSDYEMMSDDDSGGSLDAMIAVYTLPTTDTYTIRATTYEHNSFGDFTIYLDEVEATPITLNETIKGTLIDKPLFYSFTIDSNTLISAYVVSEDGLLDTLLNIQFAQYGYSIGFDDDSGYIYDSELNNISANELGEYIVTIVPATADTKGDFELRIVTEPKSTLECDSTQTISFSQKMTQALYTMDVKPRQDIVFTFYGNNTSLQSLYTSASLNKEHLPVDFITDIDGQTRVEIYAPFTGQLNINISDYAFRPHTFQLDVSCP